MDGILIIDKPPGITSTRVVEKVRRKLRARTGHTGTLDPLAGGVLLLLIGRATRFSWLFSGMDKGYRVVGRLGVETDTYDAEGKVIREREVSVSCDQLREVLGEFTGEIEQMPPPFSAKKIRGKRAYRLARKGVKPELKPVRVRIYTLELLSCNIPEFEIRTVVSSGTYVRSLIHDIGRRLSTGAIVKELVRTEVGPFSLSEAVGLESFLRSEDPWSYVIPVDRALSFLPAVNLNRFLGERVLHGNPVLLPEDVEGYVRIYVDGAFAGVGRVESGVLKPERLLITGSPT